MLRKKKSKGGGDAEGGYDTDCSNCRGAHATKDCPERFGICGECEQPGHKRSQCPTLNNNPDRFDDGGCMFCEEYDCPGGDRCPEKAQYLRDEQASKYMYYDGEGEYRYDGGPPSGPYGGGGKYETERSHAGKGSNQPLDMGGMGHRSKKGNGKR